MPSGSLSLDTWTDLPGWRHWSDAVESIDKGQQSSSPSEVESNESDNVFCPGPYTAPISKKEEEQYVEMRSVHNQVQAADKYEKAAKS